MKKQEKFLLSSKQPEFDKNKEKIRLVHMNLGSDKEKNPEAHFLHIKYLQHHIIVKKHCNSVCLRCFLMIHDDNVMYSHLSHSLYVQYKYIVIFLVEKEKNVFVVKSR